MINPLWDAQGGSDWRAIEMYKALGTALILKLRADPALRDRVSRAARRTVEDLYAGRAWQNKLAFFLPSEHEPRWVSHFGDSFGLRLPNCANRAASARPLPGHCPGCHRRARRAR